MHERLDRIRQVGRTEAGGQIAVVTFENHDTVRKFGIAEEARREPGLDRAHGDSGAADG